MRSVQRWATTAVCLVGLVVTAMVTTRLLDAAADSHHEDLEQATETLRAALDGELRALQAGLVTVRDVLVAGQETGPRTLPSPEDFDRAAAAVTANGGVLETSRAIALIRSVSPAELAAGTALRDPTGAELSVHPPPDEQAYVVQALAPLEGNEDALGFDIGSEARRRLAVELGRDNGTPTLTRPIQLVQHDSLTATVLFVPIYDTPTVPLTEPVRRARFIGGVTAAIEPAELIDAVLVRDLHLEFGLVDVGNIGLVGSDLSTGDGEVLLGPVPADPAVEADISVGDRRWRLVTVAGEGFPPANRLPALIIALAGALLTLLLAALVRLLTDRHAHVSRLVAEATADLTANRARLQSANAQLRAADEAKTRFLVTVSHELRTPLTTVRGFASLLEQRREELSEAERIAFTSQLARSAEGLSDLLQEVLEFAHEQAEGPRVRCTAVDVAAVVERRVEQQPSTHEIVVIDTATGPALADPTALDRVVGNVLANARSYSPDGSRIGVWIRSSDPEGEVEVVIDDQGPGIPEEEREQVFERFHRGSHAASGTVPGTGIGLTVARDLVEAMGGRIVIGESGLGGTRMTISLPLGHVRAEMADTGRTSS